MTESASSGGVVFVHEPGPPPVVERQMPTPNDGSLKNAIAFGSPPPTKTSDGVVGLIATAPNTPEKMPSDTRSHRRAKSSERHTPPTVVTKMRWRLFGSMAM